MNQRADIVIIGGGIVGSSIAYHLVNSGEAGEVLVLERDPSYQHAATPHSNGGIRRLFSLPENIAMASYGLEFYRRFAETMGVGGQCAHISFRRQGYLFVSDAGGSAQMRDNYQRQLSLGVDVEAFDAAALKRKFPSLNTADVAFAVLSANDAWIDPHAALFGFRDRARELGARYAAAEVQVLEAGRGGVTAARLSSGERITADVFVNACGAWCAPLAASVGIELPVGPMSRESYFLNCARELEPLPFIKTETDLAFRPDGDGYIGGVPDWSEPAGWNFEVSPTHFENVVWPALAHRIPAMNELRLERSWRGHYARNRLDYSPILGRCGDTLPNLLLANGFSGHGIMHAPATGRGLAELILRGEYQSLDLGCFGYQRVITNKPYREQGII